MSTARKTLRYTARDGSTAKCTITAKLASAVYIDLSFDGAHPSEVINIYDYERGESERAAWFREHPEETRASRFVAAKLAGWIAGMDAEEQHYGGPFVGEQPRVWLRAYVENAR